MRRTTTAALKRTFFCFTLCLALLAAGCAWGPSQTQEPSREYGVFLGINATDMERLEGYDLVVIEPSEFQAEQIEAMHAAGQTVYGYLNIGAIETYRPYYGRFQGITQGVYEDWPDERWVDVTSPEWQEFIVDDLGKTYADMGLDGVVATNTTIDHDLGEGGLSGAPLLPRSLEVVRRLRDRLGEGPIIIGVGGISSIMDAELMLDAGADLLQAYTAFVYNGPAWPGRINRALATIRRR